MAHKIQDEFDQVERQVYILEKEENELRRVRKKKVNQSKRSFYNLLSIYCYLWRLTRKPRGSISSYAQTIYH